jgi:hypothetical protein
VIGTAASASDNAIGNALLDRATASHPHLTNTWVDARFKTLPGPAFPRIGR